MLVHVRDPLMVIEEACKGARETIIIAEGSFEADEPYARFYGAMFPGTNSWWHLSTALYRDVFSPRSKKTSQSTYMCNIQRCTGSSRFGRSSHSENRVQSRQKPTRKVHHASRRHPTMFSPSTIGEMGDIIVDRHHRAEHSHAMEQHEGLPRVRA